MLFNNHEFFLFSQERPSLDRARDTDKMKAAIKAKMSRKNFGKCLPSFYHSKLCSKLFKKWSLKCLFFVFFLFIRKVRPKDTDRKVRERMKVSIEAKMSGTWGSLCPDYWPQTRHPTTLRELATTLNIAKGTTDLRAEFISKVPHKSPTTLRELATASKKESTRKALEETQVSAKSVHRKQMFTWTFCKCTLFKHEIEEASEQLGATTGWITTNVGHKVRRIRALNSVRLPKHKHTGPQAGPQVRLHLV